MYVKQWINKPLLNLRDKLQFKSPCSYFMNEDVRNLPKFPPLGRAMNLELRSSSKVWALLITSAAFQPVQFLWHTGLFGIFWVFFLFFFLINIRFMVLCSI